MRFDTFLKAKELNERITEEMEIYNSLNQLYKNSSNLIVVVKTRDPISFSYNFPIAKELFDLITEHRELSRKEIDRMKAEFEAL